ncbi:MAG: HdeD family acid-resistance protein [Chloroflexota bacterium]
MTTHTAHVQESVFPWWMVLLEGIAVLIMGLMLLSAPAQTTIITVQILGFYWLIAGVLKMVSIFVDRTMWGWKLFAGILGIFAGIVIIQHPIWSPLVVGSTIIIILGFQGILYGVVGVIQAFRGAGWGAGIMGAISILFGILLLVNVWVATFSLPWVLGILAVVGGIIGIIGAFRLR